MLEFSPDALATWTAGRWVGRPSRAITGFTIDSRTARSGDCFVALRTARRDGHDFVAAAMENGAIAAIVERPVEGIAMPQLVTDDSVAALQACGRAHRARFPGVVIGVTGSAGKTSTKEMLLRMLGPRVTLATSGNLNNYLGVPLTLLQLEARKHRFAVIEVGINRPGEMEGLASLVRPNIGIVTSVGAAHLEGLGSLEQVAVEKALLLEAVTEDGFSAFPEDCARYPAFRRLKGQRRILGARSRDVPLAGAANVTFQTKHKLNTARENPLTRESGRAVPERPGAVELSLHLPGRPGFAFPIPPMSAGMHMNAALAATVAVSLGIPADSVGESLGGWQPTALRGESRRTEHAVYYIDCYNANPLSMQDALSYFSERYADHARLFVIGSMRELGESSDAAHHSLGKAVRLAARDRAIFIGESAEILRAGALAAGNPPGQLQAFASAADARPSVAAFKGAVFLKGSRAFRLETLLPSEEYTSC